MKTMLIVVGIIVGLIVIAGIIGKLVTFKVFEVTKTTTASKEAIFELWADVPNRTRWDEGLEWATANGEFKLGATGELKVKGQPARKYEIIEYEKNIRYTDRFFLPLGSVMDWHHSIEELGNGTNAVTFSIDVNGPTALMLLPIMKSILKGEIPQTVEKLNAVAAQ